MAALFIKMSSVIFAIKNNYNFIKTEPFVTALFNLRRMTIFYYFKQYCNFTQYSHLFPAEQILTDK